MGGQVRIVGECDKNAEAKYNGDGEGIGRDDVQNGPLSSH